MALNNLKIKNDFPILDNLVHGKKFIYLDSAATTLKPQSVVDTLNKHFALEASNIHRGVYYYSEKATIDFENTRERCAQFLNASSSDEIVCTSGTTHSINLLAHGLLEKYFSNGDEIIISELEHHANILPWQLLGRYKQIKLTALPLDVEGNIQLEKLSSMVSKKTKLISLSLVSNAFGAVLDWQKVVSFCQENDILLHVDAAQAVSHFPLDLQKNHFDFLSFSGHKLYGPTGVGFLYIRQKHFDKFTPFMGGGDMIEEVQIEKSTYAKIPSLLEPGTPNIGGFIAMKSAFDYVSQFSWQDIYEHDQSLIEYTQICLDELDFVTVIGKPKKRVGSLMFNVQGVHPHDLGTYLDKQGIALRTGHHCAQVLMRHFGLSATARVSFGLYNQKSDVDTLVSGLIKAKEFFA